MDKSPKLGLVGGNTLLGREIRDLVSTSLPNTGIKLIADEDQEPGLLTAQAGEITFLNKLTLANLKTFQAIFLAGSPESTRDVLEAGVGGPLIDLTYAAEESPKARLRAPMLESDGSGPDPDAVHVIAHPAAIGIALVMRRVHEVFPIRRSIVHVFEPASERGVRGLDELQQQTTNLLAFKGLPKEIYDAQLSFNILARYGEEAPLALDDVELRIERHLASVLSVSSHAPMPSLRLLQVPVFHGYSFSLWMEFVDNPGVTALESTLAEDPIDLRSADLEPPNVVGQAGQSGIAVGAIAVDRNHSQACWLFMAADNLRLAAENALAVARPFLQL